MRLVWDLEGFTLDRPGIAAGLGELARRFDLTWELTYSDQRPRVVIFATKAAHCLYDLLLSQQLGELGGEIACVVSNHGTLRTVCDHFDMPFALVEVERGKKPEAEARQQALLEESGADLVVLARYMQILSPEFVERWPSRIINIHHSFLPAFVGAKPYHQAKERGVKIIGATAHYVTADLDQGPIIEQDVCRVSHRDEVADLERKGRDLERQVLTRAVRLHLQRRVLVHANRTIVFGT
jgi:formyltetrahydrofolate deformylase